MEAEADLFAKRHLHRLGDDHLVMLLTDATPGKDLGGGADAAKIVADQEKAEGLSLPFDLYGLKGKRRGLRHAGDGLDAVLDVLGDAGALREGTVRILLHHPEVGLGGVEHGEGVGEEAAVNPSHAHHDPEQQA